ncbi:MAG: BMP family lipoprotein, partial [Fusobacteriaceae bacterium]
MKKNILILLLAIVLFFVSCSKQGGENNGKKLKVGIVLATPGGLGDKSFNDSAYRGLERAKKELGIEFKYVEPATITEYGQYLKEFANSNYDLIIGVGFTMRDAVDKIAEQYPNEKFALIDEEVNRKNVKNLTFKEQEGSFLVGALAAMTSKTGILGFVGGGDFPLIQKFQRGFEQGAKYVKPSVKILTTYIGGESPFNDPVRAKEVTISEISQGADVVYHAAGGSGIGVINAAKEKEKFAIGVDSNQDEIAPGYVLTSMIKSVDIAVFNTVKELKEGKFTSGTEKFGIKEGGVGTSDFKFTKN